MQYYANNAYIELASCIVVAAISITAVGYFAAVLPVVIIVLYFIQNFYLRTSRQLRLLEYVYTQSPISLIN